MMIYNDFVLKNCNNDIKQGCERLRNQVKPQGYASLNSDYPIHYLAFNDDCSTFIDYFLFNNCTIDINSQDLIGNTPLLLASMKGHRDFITILVFLNVDVSIRNKEGWSALQESISYGSLEIVTILTKLYKIQNTQRINEAIKNELTYINNREFILDFTWDVKTWVPIISRYLPSDKCKLTKSGSKLRFDSTLVDFSDHKWCRGNLSCIINPDISSKEIPNQIFLLNNDKKIYQIIQEFDEKDLKKEVFFLFTSDIVDLNLDLDNVKYYPKLRFWPFNNDFIIEKIGYYNAKIYDMNDVKVLVKRRREHISKEQIANNKVLRNKLQMGNLDVLQQVEFKLSGMDPPPKSNVTWEEYAESMASTKPLILGRQPIIKTTTKNMNFSVGMSDEFPLEITEILDILEMILPIKKIQKLREICSTNLPPGFPVTIDIPIFPTVSANISFQQAQVQDIKIDPELFIIPEDFKMVHDISSNQ